MPVFKAAVLFDSTNAALGFKLGRSKRWSRSDSGPCSSAAAVVSASPSPSRKASPASCAVSLENVNANVNAPRVGACASSSTSSPSFSSSSPSSSSPSPASHSQSFLNFIPFPSSGDQDQVVHPDHRHHYRPREISQPDLSSNMAPRSSTAGCLDLLRRASSGTSPAYSLSLPASPSSPASATQQDRDRRKRVNARLPPATLPRKRPRLGQERQQQQRRADDTSSIGPRSDPAAAQATTPRPAQRRPLFADPHEVRFMALVQRSVARSASCAGNAALVAQDRLLASRLHALLVARGCRECLLIDVDADASADPAMDVDVAVPCSVKQDSASPASVRPSDVDVEMEDISKSALPRSSMSPPLATLTECTLPPSQLVACLLMRHRYYIGRAPGLRRSGCASSASCDGSVAALRAPWSPRISSPLARDIVVRL